MALIKEEDKQLLQSEFNKYLRDDVDLVVFTSENEDCRYCKEVVQICDELSETSEKISVKRFVFEKDNDECKKYGVTKYPAVAVTKHGETSGRIKYYGIPSGYEFGSVIEDIKMVSTNEAKISAKAMEIISRIDKPVSIKVFVTTSCPYCPRAVGTAHKFALANSNISGEMIEAGEFSNDANEFGVSSVPHIVINGDVQFVGARSDEEFAQFIMEAYNHSTQA
ncbi:Glutaredoxin-like protein [mine drainage metagenome]|uniref:Glutaredoxin-like protein n=1 Tax=mine drainage metagenome TaxID=410659 RepID=T0ZRD3_9ZZZZ